MEGLYITVCIVEKVMLEERKTSLKNTNGSGLPQPHLLAECKDDKRKWPQVIYGDIFKELDHGTILHLWAGRCCDAALI